MDMFDNYPMPINEIPNNTPKCVVNFHVDASIMIDSIATHKFEIPEELLEDCTDIEVTYNQGLRWILTKSFLRSDVVIEDHINVLYCTLSQTETNKFKFDEAEEFRSKSEFSENAIINELLDTTVQLKFINEDDKAILSDIYKIVVKNSLIEQPLL